MELEKSKLKEYAELKKKERELKVQVTELGKTILNDMQTNSVEKQVTEYGTFSIKQTTRWDYSKKVDKLKKELKATEKDEQTSGVATPTYTPTLTFYGPKPD